MYKTFKLIYEMREILDSLDPNMAFDYKQEKEEEIKEEENPIHSKYFLEV